MTRSALFLSPHLDDVAFSCGGTLIRLVEEGWRVRLCTAFTGSVLNPQGFALACQLDKGLSAEADYMQIRRREDEDFATGAGVPECVHLLHLEAPHRGYGSAPDLFSGVHQGDEIWRELAEDLREQIKDQELIFAPQGLGNHVDHLQTIHAVLAAGLANRAVWYRDTPYAIRNPSAQPSFLLPAGLQDIAIPINLPRKSACCAAYRTQVPFQFGSEEEMRRKLERFHREAAGYTESFLCSTDANISPSQSRTIIRGIS